MFTLLALLKALLMSIFPFYRTTFPEANIPPAFTYVIYSNGAKIQEKRIAAGDVEYDAIKRVLIFERTGWIYDFNTYVPARVYSSTTMNINCWGGGLVVNYKDGAHWAQISKLALRTPCERDPNELPLVRSALLGARHTHPDTIAPSPWPELQPRSK